MEKLLVALLVSLMVSGCAGEAPSVSRRHVSPAQPVVQRGMSYEQYRHYADSKAERDGGEEAWQRRQEASEGNRALQKRFMALDRNNNGSLSPDEFSGY